MTRARKEAFIDGVADFVTTAKKYGVPSSGFIRGAQLVLRALGGAVTGKKLAGIGAGFAAAFLDVVVQKQGAELWLNAPLQELILAAAVSPGYGSHATASR